MTSQTADPRGRGVARTGFIFGSLTSVATNVLHTYLPGVQMPSGSALVIAARLGSAIWPIGLLLSIEVLARVTWRRGRGWRIARFGGAGTVAFGSAIISYTHVRDVLLAWGYGHPAAEFGPLTLDGLMVVCGFALLSLTPVVDGPTDSTETARAIGQPRIPTRGPKHSPAQEIPLTAQIEALPSLIPSAVGSVTTERGHTETVVPHRDTTSGQQDAFATAADTVTGQADNPADTQCDARRERARELHARGWTHGRIAVELAVSKRTVRRYLSARPDTPDTPADRADIETDTSAAGRGSSLPDVGLLTVLDTHHDNHHEEVLS